MQYGDFKIDVEELECYFGFDLVNENVIKFGFLELFLVNFDIVMYVFQREVDFVYFKYKVLLCDFYNYDGFQFFNVVVSYGI